MKILPRQIICAAITISHLGAALVIKPSNSSIPANNNISPTVCAAPHIPFSSTDSPASSRYFNTCGSTPNGFSLPSLHLLIIVEVRSRLIHLSPSGISDSIAQLAHSFEPYLSDPLDKEEMFYGPTVWVSIRPLGHVPPPSLIKYEEAGIALAALGSFIRQWWLFSPLGFEIFRDGVGKVAEGEVEGVGDEEEEKRREPLSDRGCKTGRRQCLS